MLQDASVENFELRIAELCPSAAGKFRKTSDRDRRYNCLAWVVGETRRPWIPGGDPISSRWPPGAPRELALGAVIASYELLGFERQEASGPEEGYECIALFVDRDEDVTHAARQLSGGRWTSKIGQWEDIEHDDLACLEGGEYGRVAAYLRRLVVTAPEEAPQARQETLSGPPGSPGRGV